MTLELTIQARQMRKKFPRRKGKNAGIERQKRSQRRAEKDQLRQWIARN